MITFLSTYMEGSLVEVTLRASGPEEADFFAFAERQGARAVLEGFIEAACVEY